MGGGIEVVSYVLNGGSVPKLSAAPAAPTYTGTPYEIYLNTATGQFYCWQGSWVAVGGGGGSFVLNGGNMPQISANVGAPTGVGLNYELYLDIATYNLYCYVGGWHIVNSGASIPNLEAVTTAGNKTTKNIICWDGTAQQYIILQPNSGYPIINCQSNLTPPGYTQNVFIQMFTDDVWGAVIGFSSPNQTTYLRNNNDKGSTFFLNPSVGGGNLLSEFWQLKLPTVTVLSSASPYNVTDDDYCIFVATNGNPVINLPDASTCKGRLLLIKNTISAPASNIVVTASLGQKVQDSVNSVNATYSIPQNQFNGVMLISDGTMNWWWAAIPQ